jgi:chromosome partitioning protein
VSRIITIASNKGGQGKTTTAIHLAAFFQQSSPTLLVDGDGIKTATKYQERGNGQGLPFKIVSEKEMPKYLRDFETVVIDTEANPSDEDFGEIANGCDFLVIPAVPKTCDIDGLTSTLARLHKIGALGTNHYKVLITMAPPAPQTDADQLRQKLRELGIPTFKNDVPYLKTFDKAAAAGVAVYDVKDDKPDRVARSWTPYEAAAKEIIHG